MGGSKNWCFTWFNQPTPCGGWKEDIMEYMICGDEVCPETKKQHIQGYVKFKDRRNENFVRRLFPKASVRSCKGTPKQNVTYCSKGGKYHDHGAILKSQGSRSDLEDVKGLIDSGCSIKDLREHHYPTYIRYQKALINDREFHLPDRSWPTELHIYWGTTGTGKSRKCFAENLGAYWKTRGDWWDGYDGNETIIIDEFYGWMSIDSILRLCDRYPLLLPTKGGFRKCQAKKVIFTSNKPWKDWWPNVDNPNVLAAFNRRITEITEFKELVTSHTES